MRKPTFKGTAYYPQSYMTGTGIQNHFGSSIEDNSHFLLECMFYDQHRLSMFNKLHDFGLITTDLLLFGDLNLSFEQNRTIFEAVQVFLKESGRFS